MLGYMREFWEQFDWMSALLSLQQLLGVLLCLTVHETCHGLAAYALGDPTAKAQRRLSLNPLHHIDWLGLAAMFLCGFGWAKPVPVDMRYFKNPKRGMALTALAGPASNFLLALALFFLSVQMLPWIVADSHSVSFLAWLQGFMMNAAVLSVGLGLFNLIPIPPLDGSKALFALLPERAYYTLMRYERYGMAVLLLLVWLEAGGRTLYTGVNVICSWMISLFL